MHQPPWCNTHNVYVFLLTSTLCSVYSLPTGILRLPWLRFFRAFFSVVRQMSGYTSQRQGTVHTLPNQWTVLFYVLFVSIVFFYVLFLCKCVLYYGHRVSTQLQLNISYHIISYWIIISHHITSYISYHIILDHHITSHHIIYIISYHISYHIIYHIISYHIISYHIISYHIIYHITSYHISYHNIYYIIYHISYIISYIIYHFIYHKPNNQLDNTGYPWIDHSHFTVKIKIFTFKNVTTKSSSIIRLCSAR